MVRIPSSCQRKVRAVSTILFLVASGFFLAGCLNPRGGSGDIRKMQLPGDYAVPANYRLIVSNMRGSGAVGSDIVCPEPSPDAAAVAAASLAASVSVEGRGSGSAGTGIAQAVTPLFARSQAIQAIRDSTSAACIAYQNGVLSRFGYYMVVAAYPDVLLGAMAIEGITDRPLHLAGGAVAAVPGVSVNGKDATANITQQSGSAPNTSTSGNAKGQSTDAEIKGISNILNNLAKRDSVFAAACMMHLTDDQKYREQVDPSVNKACRQVIDFEGRMYSKLR